MRADLIPKDFYGRTARLVEECGEVQQAIGKGMRFGWRAIDAKTGIQYDNAKDLCSELRDLKHAIDDFLTHHDRTG